MIQINGDAKLRKLLFRQTAVGSHIPRHHGKRWQDIFIYKEDGRKGEETALAQLAQYNVMREGLLMQLAPLLAPAQTAGELLPSFTPRKKSTFTCFKRVRSISPTSTRSTFWGIVPTLISQGAVSGYAG